MAAVMRTLEALITDKCREELNSLTTPIHSEPSIHTDLSVAMCDVLKTGKESEA